MQGNMQRIKMKNKKVILSVKRMSYGGAKLRFKGEGFIYLCSDGVKLLNIKDIDEIELHIYKNIKEFSKLQYKSIKLQVIALDKDYCTIGYSYLIPTYIPKRIREILGITVGYQDMYVKIHRRAN